MNYPAAELNAMLEDGPAEGDTFFRLKVTGNGETRWLNISRCELEAVVKILDSRKD